MAQIISREEVAQNNTATSLWCIIDARVYDLTDFVDAHPGGEHVLLQVAGQDATAEFFGLHRHEVLQKYQSLCIGALKDAAPEFKLPEPGDISQVPYAEPLWLRSWARSTHFSESHRRLQRAVRMWVDTTLRPEALEKETSGEHLSEALQLEMGELNLNAMRMGPGPHLKGRRLMGGVVQPEEFDYFHEMIITQELCRTGARSFNDGNLGGMVIGLPAVLHHCRDSKVRLRATEECLAGRKRICLAISEAFAGSDVAGMRTTAVKSSDGSHYTVNGSSPNSM
jgi:predicted heme/steroid binding protein